MHNKNDLKILNKAIKLAADVYKLLALLPKEEQYSIKSQIARAVVSIASNIAEGAGRNSDKEFIQFLSIAQGSTYEVDVQFKICLELKYYNESQIENVFADLEEIQKMNRSLQNHLSNKIGTKK